MNLNRVTITGADNDTDVKELLDLSAEFPFVEWGILVSERRVGSPRFPSNYWIDSLCVEINTRYHMATHVCGQLVKDLLVGKLDWNALPNSVFISDRIQINTGEVYEYSESIIQNLECLAKMAWTDDIDLPDLQFIFQSNRANNPLAQTVHNYGINTAILFDQSRGTGILPVEWPEQHTFLDFGNAGGLGPDNIEREVSKMEKMYTKPYWIDMENNVRTNDKLDLDKVRIVLSIVKKLYEQLG